MTISLLWWRWQSKMLIKVCYCCRLCPAHIDFATIYLFEKEVGNVTESPWIGDRFVCSFLQRRIMIPEIVVDGWMTLTKGLIEGSHSRDGFEIDCPQIPSATQLQLGSYSIICLLTVLSCSSTRVWNNMIEIESK